MLRVDYLEKILGSKTSITDKDGGDKLPLIKRAKIRDREQSHN